MGQQLDDLSVKVDAVVAGEAKVHALLDQVKAALDNALASGNPAQLQALSDKLAKLSADQEAAIAADTPVVTPVVAEWGYVAPKGKAMLENTAYRSDTNDLWMSEEDIRNYLNLG